MQTRGLLICHVCIKCHGNHPGVTSINLDQDSMFRCNLQYIVVVFEEMQRLTYKDLAVGIERGLGMRVSTR